MDFACGRRDARTFKKLWGKIKNRSIKTFFSDHWKSYTEKCYSKSQYMPKISLKLLFLKLNGMPTMLD